MAPGGGQEYFGITPDVAILGKILGGGFPVGAIAGSREIMERMDPLLFDRPRFSFHGGTFTANPTTMSAGLKMLQILEDGSVINHLNKKGDRVRDDLESLFSRYRVEAKVTSAGSLFQVHFTKEEVENAEASFRADKVKLADFHKYLIRNGVFFLPTRNGAISQAHSDIDLQKFLTETENYLKKTC